MREKRFVDLRREDLHINHGCLSVVWFLITIEPAGSLFLPHMLLETKLENAKKRQ